MERLAVAEDDAKGRQVAARDVPVTGGTIEEVLCRTDILELVQRAGGQPRQTSGGYHCSCPLHHGDNPTAFSIYREDGKQKWKCWTHDCGGGDVLDFVMAWQGINFVQAIEYLGGTRIVDRGEVARLAAERAERAAKDLQTQIDKAQKILTELREAQTWIKYHNELDAEPERRQLWEARGIPEVWQDLWYLGYAPSFTCSTSLGYWTTPTLSIPIFEEDNPNTPISLRHRLLNPPTPKDKYRPDRAGLKSAPFVCIPEDRPENVLVVEGEIKAMVTYLALDSIKWQVIGLAGKCQYRNIIPQLQGRQVVICLDPDAMPQALDLARQVNGRVMDLCEKIDDAILAGMIDKDMLRCMIRQARKVK